MPQRSSIARLPSDVQSALEARLVKQGFGDYSALAEWLADQGYQISRSAVHRHGVQLERRLKQIQASTQAAESLRAASPDDEDALSDSALRLVQSRIFDLLMAAEDDEIDMKEISGAARAIADTARAKTVVGRERRAILKEAAERAARSAEEAARDVGTTLPPEVLQRIRRDVYGIHDGA